MSTENNGGDAPEDYKPEYNDTRLEDSILDDWDSLGGTPPETKPKDTPADPPATDDDPPAIDSDGDGGDDTTDPKGDADSDDDTTPGSEDDDGLELNLVPETDENYNETLVTSVESLLMNDHFVLDDEKIIELFDGTEESWDKLQAANNAEIMTQAQASVWNSIPEKGREFFQYLQNAGADAQIKEWLELEQTQDAWEAIDTENLTEDQAKEIVSRKEKERGTKDRYIDTIIQSLVDDNEVVKMAKEIVSEEVAATKELKAKQLADDTAASAERAEADTKKFNSTVAAIHETKFSKDKQQEIYSMIYQTDKNSGVSPIVGLINNVFQNPKYLVQLVTLFEGFDENGFNVERVKKQIQSDVTAKTKRKIRRKTASTKPMGNGGDPLGDNKSWTPSDEELGL